RLKERPLLDSLTSSTHFVGPAVFGLALSGAPVGLPAVASLVAFFLWGMASHAFGAVQDVQPDRDAGIGSIATVVGAARTVRLSMALYAAAGLVMLLAGWPAALPGLLALPYLVSIWPFRAVCDDRAEQAHRGWRRFLWVNLGTCFLLTQLLIWLTLRSSPRPGRSCPPGPAQPPPVRLAPAQPAPAQPAPAQHGTNFLSPA